MAEAGTFTPGSFWLRAPAPPADALAGTLEVDVGVIGGGLTGLSAALAFRAAGLSVSILERDLAGAGASGRSCGQVGADIGKNLPTLRRHLGRERARAATSVLRAAVAHLEALVAAHAIECDYRPTGNVFAGVHPRQARFIERAAGVAQDLGIPVELLDARALRDRGIPPAVACGYLEGIGGSLDPGRYVAGLRRAVLAAGATLFERTPVLHVEEGPRLELRTARGLVRCRLAVLATNAYTPALGWLRHTILPLAVSALVTEPLTLPQRDRLGWPGREPLYTAHHVLENLRWTPDGRILVGTKRTRVGFGSRLAAADDAATFGALVAVLRARFPELDDVGVATRWTGYVALTPDFLPVFGRTGRHRNLLYAAGYAGHGLSLASYAGRILVDLALDRDLGPAAILVRRLVPPLPPEPLRWLAAQALLRGLRWRDDRLDRAVRACR